MATAGAMWVIDWNRTSVSPIAFRSRPRESVVDATSSSSPPGTPSQTPTAGDGRRHAAAIVRTLARARKLFRERERRRPRSIGSVNPRPRTERSYRALLAVPGLPPDPRLDAAQPDRPVDGRRDARPLHAGRVPLAGADRPRHVRQRLPGPRRRADRRRPPRSPRPDALRDPRLRGRARRAGADRRPGARPRAAGAGAPRDHGRRAR